jgi:hypothetical protein
MSDAIPREWILEIERGRDQRNKAQLDEWKRDDPEWYEAIIHYTGSSHPTSDEVRDCLMNNKKFKEWHSKRIALRIKTSQKYAFTLTTNVTNDNWVQAEQDMIQASYKLYSQTTCTIVDGDCYLEYTKDGRPHIHGWYQTENGGRVYAKVFGRIWKLWDEDKKQGKGHQGGFHEKVKSLHYEQYASAEERKVCGKSKGIFTPG